MKNIQEFVLVLIIVSVACVPVMAASQDDNTVTGSKESMDKYQGALSANADPWAKFFNFFLGFFGAPEVKIEKPGDQVNNGSPIITTTASPSPTAIRERPMSATETIPIPSEVPKEPVLQTVSGDSTVNIANNAFVPNALIIRAGSQVRWTNNDDHAHRIMFQNQQYTTFLLGPEQSSSQQFNRPGTYDYSCNLYPSMQGRITVV